MTRSFKHLLICTSIALIAACGSQDSAVSDNNMPAAFVNIASTAPKNVAVNAENSTPEASKEATPLLSSLAANYPGGQLPADRAAAAAAQLAQNPAALKQTAPIQVQSLRIEAQSASIQPQATAADYQPVQRIQNASLYGAYFFSIYSGEVTSALAGNPNWKLEGPAFWASLATGIDLHPVHRFQNKLNGSYLYTIYDGERANIVANYSATFAYEGIAWYARQTQTPAPGWSALYRFRNKTNGTYLFTAYESEKDAIVANYPAVFELEGIAYYVRQETLPAACTAAPIVASETYSLVFKGCNAANVAEYYDKTECVRDNSTGLIWESKTTAGLRANNFSYTNYDSATGNQNYNAGTPTPATQLEIDALTNTLGFKKAVNDTRLCGSNAWRVPSQGEFISLVSSGKWQTEKPTWFPNVSNWNYWTSTPSATFSYQATIVSLRLGVSVREGNRSSGGATNDDGVLLMLVR